MNGPILIIAAMGDIELDYLKTKVEEREEKEYNSFKFIKGKMFEKDIILCISNIGLINAAAATTIAIEKYNPKVIINQGLAGGYTKWIHKGDIAIGLESINITSMKGNVDSENINDYEIVSFLSDNPSELIKQKADERIVQTIRENFNQNNLHYRNNCKWGHME